MKPLKCIEMKAMEDLQLLHEKELVLAIISLQHLYNKNFYHIGRNTFITGVSTISGIIVDLPIGKIALATLSVVFATKLVLDVVDVFKIRKLKNMLVEELIGRFTTPQVAYLEIAEMISSVTREELIDYLNSIGCEVINVK